MSTANQVAALRVLTTAPNPDARLLATCDRLSILWDELDQLWRHKPRGYLGRSSEIVSESDALVAELVKRPARTAAGRLAKGEIAARGIVGGGWWANLARSALADYQNADRESRA